VPIGAEFRALEGDPEQRDAVHNLRPRAAPFDGVTRALC
jgi:hypothetical protein